jgi:hypothetical protein
MAYAAGSFQIKTNNRNEALTEPPKVSVPVIKQYEGPTAESRLPISRSHVQRLHIFITHHVWRFHPFMSQLHTPEGSMGQKTRRSAR